MLQRGCFNKIKLISIRVKQPHFLFILIIYKLIYK